ncbi:MAG: serine/threonine-protein kinase, partial [Planctomycetota bacterium]
MDWEAFYNSFRKPDFIPGYEIQNRLGGGAFGDVYKARKQSIGKAYAIKFLKIEDDGQREAVQRELGQVRHFAAIDHPNLVTIEDMGTVLDVPYLIMGYAGEETLSRRLKAGKLERDDALLYFTQACRGVLALHDRRLVHFDLKPSNIFIKGDVARVGDYGLSKLLTDGRMTLSFGRGTPQYMAPEILRSRADHRADIYSLGVILFESLSGELPFQPNVDAGLVLREDDDPPEFPEDFPAFVRPVVEGCLRLAADDRFQDVGELLQVMGQTARQGDSVRIDWSAEAAARPARTSRPSPARGSQGGAGVEAGVGVGDGVGTGAHSGSGSSTIPGEEHPTPSGDLRRTAADLARGAVEVARGVWDGLRAGSSVTVSVGRSSKTPDGNPAPSAGTTGSGPDGGDTGERRGPRRFRRKRKAARDEVQRAKDEILR